MGGRARQRALPFPPWHDTLKLAAINAINAIEFRIERTNQTTPFKLSHFEVAFQVRHISTAIEIHLWSGARDVVWLKGGHRRQRDGPVPFAVTTNPRTYPQPRHKQILTAVEI